MGKKDDLEEPLAYPRVQSKNYARRIEHSKIAMRKIAKHLERHPDLSK